MNIRALWQKMMDVLFPVPEVVRAVEELALLDDGVERCLAEWRGCEPPPIYFSHAVFSYRQEMVRAAIWEVKYRRNEAIAGLLGKILRKEIERITWILRWEDALVVPIPLSAEKLKERGYNQVELMLPECVNALVRVEHTVAQSHTSSRAARMANLKGIFEMVMDVRGKNIVLVDDVITTGATMSEARDMLLEAGAKGVLCVAIAH